MNLPKIETPTYSLTIPSSKKSVKYRPFLVKEEKVLMIAQESKDETQIMQAMYDVVKACTFNEVDILTLTNFDIEYIFIKLRAKSVGEEVKIGVKCDSCETVNEIGINLDSCEVTFEKDLPKKIMLTDKIGVVPRYMTSKYMSRITSLKNDPYKILTVSLMAIIESIFDDAGVYRIDDTTDEDFETFIGSLNRSQMSKLEELITSTPKLEKEVKFNCKSCSTENVHTLSGSQAFFV
jgi:hypothetical protein